MDHKVDRSLFFKGDAVTHVKSLSHLNPAKVGEGIRYCELSGCFSWWWFGRGGWLRHWLLPKAKLTRLSRRF